MNTEGMTGLVWGALVVGTMLVMSGCQSGGGEASGAAGSRGLALSEATWEAGDARLELKGRGEPRQRVRITDSMSGQPIGEAQVDSDGQWRLSVDNLVVVPCRVRARADDEQDEREIDHAPLRCRDRATLDTQEQDEHDRDEDAHRDSNTGSTAASASEYQLFAVNDLGMHCMDEDFSVFSVLPPFNNLQAQVVKKGAEPVLMSPVEVELRYAPVVDASGSINSTSIGKTNFWEHVQALFGAAPAPDVGLTGNKMPSADNGPQPFSVYEAERKRYLATGIPITPWDDFGQHNSYPMFRVEAVDKVSGEVLASLDTVVPVSEEMACADCHHGGGEAADGITASRYNGIAWSDAAEPAVAYKENILLLHDAKHDTRLMANQPVLCAQCHYSPALDLAGSGPQGAQTEVPYLSFAIHRRHGETLDGELPGGDVAAIVQASGKTTCYNCHPGEQTQCFRGAMADAGLNCQDCHGGMLAVGGQYPLANGNVRRPWQDLPKCQSCHTGDALIHQGSGPVRRVAYDPTDPAATPLLADNKRFAESDTGLYRNSAGHGEMGCTACHGSPHAIWPNGDPAANDNVAARQIQGYAGTITECSSCHTPGSLPLTLGGPHGMHNVNDVRWNEAHGDFYERDPAACQGCHGVNLEGTRLSRTAVDRTYLRDDDGNDTLWLAKGTEVSCVLCHERPQAEGGDD